MPLKRQCYVKDRGRPPGAALQEEASNHLKLLWSKAMVVSIKEKAPEGVRCVFMRGEHK
jgi:hypothetical protein